MKTGLTFSSKPDFIEIFALILAGRPADGGGERSGTVIKLADRFFSAAVS
jgi:hypothetical protein